MWDHVNSESIIYILEVGLRGFAARLEKPDRDWRGRKRPEIGGNWLDNSSLRYRKAL